MRTGVVVQRKPQQPKRRTTSMRYPVLSVEWGIYAASRSSLPRGFTHCVMPDLDEEVMPRSHRDSFYDVVPRRCQIRTVAVNNHGSSTNAWLRHVSTRINEGQKGSDNGDEDLETPAHLLVVGGNHKNGVDDYGGGGPTSLSTAAAIRECTTTCCFGDRPVIAWAVADLNAPNSIDDVLRKIEAGATGIITQPLLSRQAYDSLAHYSEIMNGSLSPTVTFVAGMALPNTLRGLLFWESLLQTRLAGDPLFQDHCKYFQSNRNDLQWALAQMKALAPFHTVKGMHFMPMKNSRTLEMLLTNTTAAGAAKEVPPS